MFNQNSLLCDISLLQCMDCRSSLKMATDGSALTCCNCGKSYPVVHGIPIMFKTGTGEEFNELAELNIQDALAVPYDEQEFRRLEYDKIFVREVDPQNDELILNLGAGRGFTSKFLIESNKTLKIVNFELILAFLEMTKNGEMLVNGSADSLPFPDNTFERIIFSDVLEHLPPEIESATLREMYRVLKPGGKVYISYPGNNLAYKIGAPILNIFLVFYRIFDKRLKYLPTKVCAAHINMSVPYVINRNFSKAGFIGKLRPRAHKFFYLPPNLRWIGNIFNTPPINYIFIPQMTGFLYKESYRKGKNHSDYSSRKNTQSQ